MTAINFPDSPSLNETFVVGDKTYEWNGTQWVVKSSTASGVDLSALDQTILPDTNEAYDLGSSTKRFRDVYLSGSSIDLGGAQITSTGSAITLPVGSTVGSTELGSGGATVYATIDDLPLSGVDNGSFALVSATNRLYVWTNSGWYNIALINQTPTITDNEASYVLAIDGTATTVTLTGTDAEGIPITWSAVTSGDTAVANVTNTDNVFTITPSTDTANQGTLTVTFRASDGVNIGTATSEFTLSFLSPYWDETVLSIGTNSTDGIANSTFIDRSTNAHTVTPTESPVQTAFHPYHENWSVEFDGSEDWLDVAGDYGFIHNPVNGFTIEFNLYRSNTNEHRLFGNAISSNETGFGVFLLSNGDLQLRISKSVTNIFTVDTVLATNIEANQWHHIAITCDGSTIRAFVNGELGGTTIDISGLTFDTGSQSGNLFVGRIRGSTLNFLDGYLSNLRIVNGTALYTSAFTPPTEKLTAASGTSLLTCQSNRFIDNSTNDHTITVNGDPKVSAFNPFGQDSEYAVGENKGSSYFDGSTSTRLTLPSDTGFAFGTGAYTIEAWVYISVTTTGAVIFDSGTASGSLSFLAEGGQLKLSKYGTGAIIQSSAGAVTNNKFSHLAIARSSTGSNDTRLFVDGILVGTGTDSNNWTTTTTPSVGGINLANYTLNGYISDLRVIKGTALYTTNFTPPTAPVGNTNASLYLPMDNAGIFDKTGNNNLTTVGNASTSTTQTKFADTAMAFDGSGDYITTNFPALGTGDFTIEGWVYFNNITGMYIFDARETSDSTTHPALNISNDWRYVSDNEFVITSGITPLSNEWYHFAICRNAGTTSLYVDGTSIGSVPDSRNYLSNPSGNIGIFRLRSSSQFNGYLENFQILKGVAKYTTNFTVPDREQGRTYQAES